MYSCKRCGYTTDIKGNLKNHFRRKRVCKSVLSSVPVSTLIGALNGEKSPKSPKFTHIYTQPTHNYTKSTHIYTQSTPDLHTNQKIFICGGCFRNFSRADSLKRHKKKNCLETKKTSETELIIENMKRELEKAKLEKLIMLNEMDKLLDKVGDTNIQNQQINIHINNYGTENTDYITEGFLKNLLDTPYNALPKLLKNIHFNPEHPENHNIKITNKKLPFIGIWRDNKWVVKDKHEMLVDIVDKGFNILDDKYQSTQKEIESQKKIILNKFQDQYYDKDKTLLKNLNKDVELLIINNSKMIKE